MVSTKQVILITGANAGIGYDTAALLAASSSNNHVIIGARNVAKGEKALAEIQARKPQGTLSFLQIDVTDDDSIAAAAKKVEADFGCIDVLINNAGISGTQGMAGTTASPTRENLRAVFETNVYGPTLVTEAVLPLLKASKSPKVINVSSGLGSITMRSDPNDPTYSVSFDVYRMSKSALNMLSACHSASFKKFGAKVWAYCPGFVVTNLTGEEDRQNRVNMGAESSETSAQGILEILEGKRDSEAGGFVTRYGKAYPW
ncbi:NAD(P)-binding protein [Melanomma pulvis-pyrius CBS 109.77]|uniref:NAD(P)-binding protein n=1 Tax=Melanomma pulvis-pyrius CBS 109.77 TaxID=1314802 RepID=A0A6A6XHJ8_9PLEO|nr:NAD(P)-binding protein [Melanomma pulvis-pyrius CBS 109.77]